MNSYVRRLMVSLAYIMPILFQSTAQPVQASFTPARDVDNEHGLGTHTHTHPTHSSSLGTCLAARCVGPYFQQTAAPPPHTSGWERIGKYPIINFRPYCPPASRGNRNCPESIERPIYGSNGETLSHLTSPPLPFLS